MAATSAAPLSAEYLAEDDSGKLIAVMWTATVLPVIFVCLRVYARLVIRKTFGWDDGIAIAALVSSSIIFETLLTVQGMPHRLCCRGHCRCTTGSWATHRSGIGDEPSAPD